MTTPKLTGWRGWSRAAGHARFAVVAVVWLALVAAVPAARADDFSLPGDTPPSAATPDGGYVISLPTDEPAPAPAPPPPAPVAPAPAPTAAPAPAPAAPPPVAPHPAAPTQAAPPPAETLTTPAGASPTQATVDSEAAPDADAATADQAFDDRTKALEQQVDDLKVSVKNSYLRLVAMSEQILGGESTSGAKLSIWHRRELGSSYVLVGAVYVLDGAPLYSKSDDTGDLNARDELDIFESRVVPGPHQLSVEYDLRGHGYGIFQYLEGMHLTLRKSLSFDAEPGKITKITSVVYERGEITLQFKDKPDINFDETVTKEVVKPPAEAEDEGGSVPAVAPGASSGSGK